jgi:hypothetical protein
VSQPTRLVWYVPAGDDLYIVQALQRDLEITRDQAEATVAYLRAHTTLGGCVSPEGGGPSIDVQRGRDLSATSRTDHWKAACLSQGLDSQDVARRLAIDTAVLVDWAAPIVAGTMRPYLGPHLVDKARAGVNYKPVWAGRDADGNARAIEVPLRNEVRYREAIARFHERMAKALAQATAQLAAELEEVQ